MLRASKAPGIVAGLVAVVAGCDRSAPSPVSTEPSASMATAAPPPPSAEEQPPEIIIDRTNVDIGKERVATGEPELTGRAAVLLRASPRIEGQGVGVVAMRAAKPSHVAAILDALRQAKAASATIRTEARGGDATEELPVAFLPTLPDCATVAWIANDAAIDVWPAGGGTAKRVLRGLAGPDVTLGLEAMGKQGAACEAGHFAVGADDAMTWGLVSDLAVEALHQPWTRASSALIVTHATPGRRLERVP